MLRGPLKLERALLGHISRPIRCKRQLTFIKQIPYWELRTRVSEDIKLSCCSFLIACGFGD